MILRALGRILLAGFGLFCAATVSVSTLFFVWSFWLMAELETQAQGEPALEMFGNAFSAIIIASGLGPMLTIVPGLVVVVIGEVFGIRSWLYYVAAGGVAVAALPLISGPIDDSEITVSFVRFLAVFASAGFAGGLIHWLIAGRSA